MSSLFGIQAWKLLLWLPFLIAFGSIVYYTVRTGISPMPSSPLARRAILGMLPADLTGAIVDLGSGWGSLAFPLARRFQSARVCGYEVSWVPFLCSRLRLRITRPPNLCIRRCDFFEVSFSEYDVVVCYLYTGAMRRLKSKLESELRPGTLVLSHTFAVHGWHPERVVRLGDTFATRIYLYRMPAC
ncbi:MAG: methyltransferase domain-containing protein [Acidobacteriota bacterium]